LSQIVTKYKRPIILVLFVLFIVGGYVLLSDTAHKESVKSVQTTETLVLNIPADNNISNAESHGDEKEITTSIENNTMKVKTVQVALDDTIETLIQKASEHGYENYDLLQALWVKAVDGNITEELLLIFKNVQEESTNPKLSSFASMVLKDLERLQKIRSGELSKEESTLSHTLNYRQLEEQLLSSDETTRSEAVSLLGNDRNGTGIPLLKEQLNDSSPQIRLLTVQSLWRIAADGFDKTYDLTYTLQTMVDDGDEAVAEAASLAVKDLMHLHHSDEYGSWQDDENVSQQNKTEIQNRQ